MTTHRHLKLDYTPKDAPQEPIEPITFELRGEQFHCVNALPGIVLLDLGIVQDPDTPVHIQLGAIKSFITSVVIPDHRTKFLELLANASPAIDVEELVYYVNELAEALSGNFTSPSSDSPTSPTESSNGSTDDSSPTPAVEVASSI